jgi:hypothetical protein
MNGNKTWREKKGIWIAWIDSWVGEREGKLHKALTYVPTNVTRVPKY